MSKKNKKSKVETAVAPDRAERAIIPDPPPREAKGKTKRVKLKVFYTNADGPHLKGEIIEVSDEPCNAAPDFMSEYRQLKRAGAIEDA